jgi:lipopolysaccharide export system protein LptA
MMLKSLCLLFLVACPGAIRAQEAAATTNSVIEVKSEGFEFSQLSGVAVWSGNVRVTDPQMNLTCGVLTGKSAPEPAKAPGANGAKETPRTPGDALNVPILGGKIESLVAEKNVVIINKRDKTRATGEKAVFNAAADTVELTGNPALQTPQGKMWADVIVLDRGNGKLRGVGNFRMEIDSELLTKTNKTGGAKSASKK